MYLKKAGLNIGTSAMYKHQLRLGQTFNIHPFHISSSTVILFGFGSGLDIK
jgi:hypothetical protein